MSRLMLGILLAIGAGGALAADPAEQKGRDAIKTLVPDARIDALGEAVGRLPFVTHCYHRPRALPLWPYNLFAMVHGKSREEVEAQVGQIAALLGADCRAHDVLYSSRILKKTGLRIGT